MSEKEFRIIFTPLMDQWYRFSLSLVGTKEDAEDVVQETLLKLWHHRLRLSGVKNRRAYCIRMVKNLCYDKLKSRQTSITLDLEKHNKREPESLVKTDAEEVMEQLKKLVDALPNRQKEIFILKDMEGLTYAEIEQITHLDISNIRANLSMARKKIKILHQRIIKDERI